jgi:hypothetical protein
VKELQKSSFDMIKLSIVGKDFLIEEHVVGHYSGTSNEILGQARPVLGGLWGFLFGT